MAVFILPQGHTLPLHDHPHMSVFSKVLYGQLQLKSFTSMDDNANSNDNDKRRLVRSDSVNDVKTSHDPAWCLTPSDGNYHEFHALTPCVVFDCLLPPYEEPERCCNYYKCVPAVSDSSSLVYELLPLDSSSPDVNKLLPSLFSYRGFRPKP